MKINEIKPVSNWIITTAEKQTVTPSGVIVPDSQTIKTVQKVLAIGPHVTGVEVSDMVELDPSTFPKKFKKPKHDIGADEEIIVPPVYTVDDGDVMRVTINNIFWAFKEEK